MIKINSNTLAMEFAACVEGGIDPYEQITQRARDWRAAITAHHLGRNMIAAMKAHDTKPSPKKGKKR